MSILSHHTEALTLINLPYQRPYLSAVVSLEVQMGCSETNVGMLLGSEGLHPTQVVSGNPNSQGDGIRSGVFGR